MYLRVCTAIIFTMISFRLDAMAEEPPHLTETQEGILNAITIYKIHLIDSLGCNACLWLNHKIETDHYLHIINRIRQLKAMEQAVQQIEWQEETMRAIASMGEFRRYKGKKFRSTCIAAIKRASSKHEDSAESCVACWDNKPLVMARDCHHLLYCKTCVAKLSTEEKLPTKCALCRSDVADYESLDEIFDTCMNCLEDACMLSPACRHIVLCATCAQGKAHCPLCDKACAAFQQVYR